MENPEKSLQQLSSLEKVAEDILRDRSEIVALDRRRNSNREGWRALAKHSSAKAWIALGPVLVKIPTDKAKERIEYDQQITDTEINKLRSDLKVKVNKLRDLEYEDPIPGLTLNPLSPEELSAINQVLGRRS